MLITETTSGPTIIDRIAELKSQIDGMKHMYEELEQLTIQLVKMNTQLNTPIPTFDGNYLILQDNFADKNTVFRPAAVKRFDVDILTQEELDKKIIKEAKALAKKLKE